jgi:NAD(P)-dependent dehydrogenase (short-subunit alcohol dehydrogenase family)
MATASSQRLRGRRVLITGATSGVGLAAAQRFAAEGARLALVSRSREALERARRDHGLDAVVIAADLGDRGAGGRAVEEAVEQLGGLDIVVSNAAAAVFGHVLEVHPDDFERTVKVTFLGAVDVIRAALPHLRESRGAIVATGSLMSRVPLPTWSSYAASKHGLRGFLNSLAIEEREQGTGVRVAMVHPGPIDTPLFSQASSSTQRMPRVAPDAYRPEVIAQALVETAVSPRKEVVLGGETRLLDVAFSVARPLAETVLLAVDRWYRSGDDAAPMPGSLWQSARRPQVSGGIPARDSLLAPLQLGRRMLPSPSTPLRFARHIGTAGVRAIGLAGTLTAPVPERPVPTASLKPSNGRVPERADRGRVSL